MNILLPIAVILPLLFAVFGRLLPKKCQDAFFVLVTVIEAALIGIIFAGQTSGDLVFALPNAAGIGLSFRADRFRALYCALTVFLWLMTMIFAMEYLRHDHARGRYCFYNLITLSGVLGVFLSDDLFTTFVFFELMSFASYPLVIHEETENAMKAGETYLGVAVISGMMLLVGIFFVGHEAGTLAFTELRAFFEGNPLSGLAFAGGILILLGFGAKAGMYPLHIWLPQAHPVAPSPASALLSGILTKTGVFGIIVLSADVFMGNAVFGGILLTLAVITMFLGALLALFSVNLKRTLACSSMSQIGFILVGVSFTVLLGEEGGLAQNGALLHMVNHSLIKLVLFMCAGVVAMNIHALDLNDIRGYGRKKPFLAVIFLIGALGIMGIPLLNGYASKTMLHESIVEYMHAAQLQGYGLAVFKAVEWIFLVSGGLTVAYMTKLFVCVFVEKNRSPERQAEFDANSRYLSPLSRAVFVLSALPLPVIGLQPNLVVRSVTSAANRFFAVERFAGTVEFFGLESLKGAAISIAIGTAVYLLIVRTVMMKKGVYLSLWPQKLDLEKLIYRPVLVDFNLWFIRRVLTPIAGFFELLLTKGILWFIRRVISAIADFFEKVIIRGTVCFTRTVVRFIALAFDRCVLFLQKTLLRPHVYRFRGESNAMRIGRLLDRLLYKNKKHTFAERMDSLADTVGRVVSMEYTSFAFAFAMISLGILIILLFAVFG